MNTIGDYIRRARLDRRLRQIDVAAQIGADPLTVLNWETGATEPNFRFFPAITEFLGYNPFPPRMEAPINVRLKAHRLQTGLSQKKLAKLLGVDPGTIGKWEDEKTKPTEKSLKKILRFLTLRLPAKVKGVNSDA